MTDKPNPADFSVNEKPREYEARIFVGGYITRKIYADSIEEAKAEARRLAEEMEDGNNALEVDEVDSVKLEHCGKTPPMFRVLRDGRNIQVSHLRAGDLPRQPDERGF